MNALLPVGSRTLAVAAAALSLAVHSSPLAAQTAADATTAGTPRIGLALSGGGARGLAHVGVLKVLEELRVPISCVTGTSMGAIVGGTFAAGRPAGEMNLTALENVMLQLELAGEAAPKESALEVLARVGLRERAGHYPSQLSGRGQRSPRR